MNTLGQTLFVLALQVALVAGAGLLLSRRRSSMLACGPLVWATCCIVLLTPLAFLPRPTWSRERLTEAHEVTPAATTVHEPMVTADPVGLDVLQLLRQLRPQPVHEAPTPDRTWSYVAYILLTFACIGLTRFAWAWWSLRRLLRHVTLIADADLQQQHAELCRSLGLLNVALAEAGLHGAATVGWRTPIVLLGSAWRQWTPAQRRAVLAHELAHVRRRDYLTRCVARFAGALHGYQPLLRWLIVRLETQQEMAADALAAPLAGGPRLYAQALASLALQADDRRVSIAPRSSSPPSLLLRRMSMLRVMDDTQRRGRRWPAFLAVTGMAVAAWALHGRTPEVMAGPIIRATFTEEKKASLDYTYLQLAGGKEDVGLCVVRLGEVLTTPGMENIAAMYGDSIKGLLGENVKLPCAIKEIEQIGGRVNVAHHPDKPAPNRTMGISLSFVRTTKDVDWVAYLKPLCKNWQEHRHAETPYFSGEPAIPLLAVGKPIHFYMPDARTLVLESAENIKKYIDAKKTPLAKPTWATTWHETSKATAVLVLPNTKDKLAKLLTPTTDVKDTETQLIVSYGKMLGHAEHAVIAFDSGPDCRLTMHFSCADMHKAAKVDQEGERFIKLLQEDALKGSTFMKEHPITAAIRRGVDFQKNAEHHVGLEFTMKGNLATMLKTAMGQ